MKISQKVRLQKQTKDGTISMTLPKKIMDVVNWQAKDEVIVELDSENEFMVTIRKSE